MFTFCIVINLNRAYLTISKPYAYQLVYHLLTYFNNYLPFGLIIKVSSNACDMAVFIMRVYFI